MIKVNLDKERNFNLNLDALIKIEEATGKSTLDGELFKKISAKDMKTIMWAGLQTEDPELTIDKVGELIKNINIMKLVSYVNAGVTEAFGEQETEKKTDG